MEITLQLFGAFRSFGEHLTLSLSQNATVSDIKSVLLEKMTALDEAFDKKRLIDSARFATETEILPETALLKSGDIIAIIPPVSGG